MRRGTKRSTTLAVVTSVLAVLLAGCGQGDDATPHVLSPAERSAMSDLAPVDVEFTTNYPRPVTLDPLHTAGDETLVHLYENFSCSPSNTSAEHTSLSIDPTTLRVVVAPEEANSEPRWSCVVTRDGTTASFDIAGHVTDGTFH